jgi:NAD(P)-dependent dehydrogenase (short-subunit alcohol dehydrogenase family)
MSARPVAVVTGASRGLGYLLARELADRGHDLVINARNEAGLAVVAADLQEHGAQVVTVPGDVADPALGQQLVDTATERFGRVDVLVANAGSIQVGPALAMRGRDFANAMDVMFYGVLHPVLAVLPHMRERRAGRILVISSIGGKLPAPHLLPYVTAKHATTGFAEALRVEVARHGISVTCAVPGLMRTGSPRNALFTGDQPAEYRWFTLGDSLPLVSMDAARAARQLVGAALKGKPEVAPTPLAKIGMRVHGLAPSTTIRLVGLVNRLLPTDETPRPMRPGHAVATPSAWFDKLTALTRRAAQRYHQYTDSSPDPTPDPASSTRP